MNNAILLALAVVLFLMREGKADDLPHRVAEVMNLPPLETVPPIVVMTDCHGHWGETDGREIRICDRVPEACRTRVIAHELAHLILAKSRGAVPEAESLARATARAADPEFKPGCDSPKE